MAIPAPPLSEVLALWPEILLSVTACALLLFDLLTARDRKAVIGWGCLGAVLVTLLGTLLYPPQGGSIFAGMFLADGYAAFFKVLFLTAAALTVLISLRYLDDEGIHRGEYYALLLFATIGMMFMAGGGDFISIYLGLELMSLSTYVLVGFIRRDGASTEGAVKYFLMGAFTSGILLYGLALLYGLTGSTNLAAVAQSLSGAGGALDNPALVLATILVVVGFGFKIAAVPFHMWAPDTYEGAPTSITAFMASAVKAAAMAGLARVFIIALFPSAEIWEVLWWILAALSMILGNVVAIAQTSLKRMLAYSSISHAGYALIGVVAATQAREVGLAGALFYMFVYLFATMGTFSMVILLTHRGFRSDKIADFAGLGRSAPLAAFIYIIFFLSLAGIPPTAGFVGKLVVFRAAIEAGYVVLAVIGVATSAIAAYYYFMVIKTMFMEEAVVQPQLSPSRSLALGLGIMVVATLLFGLFPAVVLNAVTESVKLLQ